MLFTFVSSRDVANNVPGLVTTLKDKVRLTGYFYVIITLFDWHKHKYHTSHVG